MNLKRLYGSGKGAAGQVRTPVEDKNTLRSRASVRVVDLISEGPVKGFCLVDGTPCADTDIVESPSVNASGGLHYPNGITFTRGKGSGYPFSVDYPIHCLVEGDCDEEAEILVRVFPRTEADKIRWQQATGDILPVYPEGRIRTIEIVNPGKGYTAGNVKVSIPPSSGQCIFFDDLPLFDTVDLSPNYKDVRYTYRLGTDDQTPLEGFDFVEEVVDAVQGQFPVTNQSGGYTFALSDRLFDRLIVNIVLNEGFYIQDVKNGDILGIDPAEAVQVRIEQRYNDGTGFTQWESFGENNGVFSFSGKTMSRYERSIEGRLRKRQDASSHSWEIRVTRVTADDEDINTSNPSSRHTKIGVGKITGITDAKLTYPNCALVGIEISAEQFSRIPVRAYQMQLLMLQVPSNYFPPFTFRKDGTLRQNAEYNRRVGEDGGVEEVYSSDGQVVEQPWDGTFYVEWTNNPALIAYNVCTQERIGLGDIFDTSFVDKWGMYRQARYCDQLVSNGYKNGAFNSFEPRFTFNAYIQAREDAFKFLTDLAASFRSMVYWAGGAILFAQNRPEQPKMQFGRSDVEGGKFTYAGTARKARHTVAVVNFNDPEAGFEQRPVVYEDFEGRLRYGERLLTITPQGCTSRGLARRIGMEAILSEMLLTDTVSFTSRSKAALLRPGDLIEIYDPSRALFDTCGRIMGLSVNEAGKSVVLLDRALPSTAFTGSILDYSLVCSSLTATVHPTETDSLEDVDKSLAAQMTRPIQITSVGAGPNGLTTLTLNEQLSSSVSTGGVWAIQAETVRPFTARVLTVERPKSGRYGITAVQWNRSLFDTLDTDSPLSTVSLVSDVSGWRRPLPPKNLRLHVNSKYESEALVFDLNISWTRPDSVVVRGYRVMLKQGLGNYVSIGETQNTNIVVRLLGSGPVAVRVFAIGLGGELSLPAQARTIVGSLSGENAEIVSGLEIAGQANNLNFESGDVSFDWRVNWSGATDSIEQGVPPVLPPTVTGYIVKILALDGTTVLLTSEVATTGFTLTLERNRELVGGPHREFIISVQARTENGAVSAPTSLRVFNELPAAPSFSIEDDKQGSAILRITSARSADFKRYRIWAKQEANFSQTDDDVVAEGDSVLYTIPLEPGLWYLRVAELDLLNKDGTDLIVSSAQAVTITNRLRLSAFDFVWGGLNK